MTGMPSTRAGQSTRAARARGFSLIELMIAMLLGLMVMAAAIAIFLSNRQSYSTTQGLGRIQETSQVAFELMARDIREAGANPCDVDLPVANVVNGAGTDGQWFTNFAQPLFGFDNGSGENSVAGSDSIRVLSMGDEVVNVTDHSGTTLQVDSDPFSPGEVLMACDMRQLAIFRASSTTAGEIGHAEGAPGGGNCSDSLSVAPAPCAAGAPAYAYPENSVVGRLQGVEWYVGANGRGGTSLFRSVNGTAEEVVEGVAAMQLTYLQPDVNATDYVPAGLVTDWNSVRAASIVLNLVGAEGSGVGGGRLNRQLEHVVNLRNRTLTL